MPYIHRYTLQDTSAALNYPFPFLLNTRGRKLLCHQTFAQLEPFRPWGYSQSLSRDHPGHPSQSLPPRMVNPTIRPKCPLKHNKYMLWEVNISSYTSPSKKAPQKLITNNALIKSCIKVVPCWFCKLCLCLFVCLCNEASCWLREQLQPPP